MRASIGSAASMSRTPESFGLKIYYFHPLLAGPRERWPDHLKHCRELGFDHVLSAPLFAPGELGDLFLTADHERAHPLIDRSVSADEVAAEFAALCRAYGMKLLLDVVVGMVAVDSVIARSKPDWFSIAAQASTPAADQPAGAAVARFDEPHIANEVADWWIARLQRLAQAGVAGVRCGEPHLLPPEIWRRIAAAVKKSWPGFRFLAWTPGLDWRAVTNLRGVGFDAAFSSVAWWDGRAGWLVEEYELLRGVGAVIGCPMAPYGPRVTGDPRDAPIGGDKLRHLLNRAAVTSSGLMIPMGVEYGQTADVDRRGRAREEMHFETSKAECAPLIREALTLTANLASLGGEMRQLAAADRSVFVLLRSDAFNARDAKSAAVVLINGNLQHEEPLPIRLDPLPPTAGSAAALHEAIAADRDCRAPLGPGEVRVLDVCWAAPVRPRRSAPRAAKAATLPRIAIENVQPSVDGGHFAAKCVAGETVSVGADVFSDGHDVIAAELLWRAGDEQEWHRIEMQLLGNDRWQAGFVPARIGRYLFTIEAWRDRYGTLCRDLEVKHRAGADVAVEIAEGRQFLERAKEGALGGQDRIIASALHALCNVPPERSVDILLSRELREAMHEAEERLFLHRHEPPFPVDVERPQASFAAWYEMFPRSATDDPTRHGTFGDVIERLPAIADMGFDVLYLPPIHPIGVTNRKGKNNSLEVGPDDVGSPYAIGSSEGGHDAIHRALGTMEDFRRLRQAATAHGMEIALDFAIQCSPDHPWLKEHPDWFNWRPDGTVRYAENPPKKYQDIVNVDFYNPSSTPPLWNALRDVVLFWRKEGVRIFRVDNPHTKPLPFWEWLIREIRDRHPEVIFLSEAFTRPKMMYRLAKVGFSQSYTYFTWRNTKQELTDYFVELTTTEVRDFFRPHLFVNTPDINPYYLQTSGRPGFLVRTALAATLSGLWGVYSGFELCEATPLPGREEYIDSDKYQIRARDFNAPGNIRAEIAKLNRLRKGNPALQSNLGLRFYSAHDEQVLLYGKMAADRGDMILVAVNLDPFRAREVTIEVPLWEWSLPDNGSIGARDLMRDAAFVWYGKFQRIRLDPAELPFAIWRIAPRVGA
jgi:starch synthase (maltosyl-transferring)